MNTVNRLIEEIDLWDAQDIVYSKLKGGLSNDNYLITDEASEKKYVLKMPPPKGALSNRIEEIIVNKKCSELNLSPQILYVSNENAFVTEYINGETITPELLQTEPELFYQCIELIKQFHTKINVSHSNYTFDFVRMQMGVKEESMYNDIKRYKEMLSVSTEIEKIICRLPQEICTCHNDLIMANFIKDNKGKCWLIDFEWSGKNELYYDLAKFSLFAEIDEEDILNTYFKVFKDYQVGKVYLYKMLNSLLVAQWCALQMQSSTLGLNQEIYELGKKHFELFFMALNNEEYNYHCRNIVAEK